MLNFIEESVVEVMIGVVVKVAWEKIGGGNRAVVIGVEPTGGGGAIVEVDCDVGGCGGGTEY